METPIWGVLSTSLNVNAEKPVLQNGQSVELAISVSNQRLFTNCINSTSYFPLLFIFCRLLFPGRPLFLFPWDLFLFPWKLLLLPCKETNNIRWMVFDGESKYK